MLDFKRSDWSQSNHSRLHVGLLQAFDRDGVIWYSQRTVVLETFESITGYHYILVVESALKSL